MGDLYITFILNLFWTVVGATLGLALPALVMWLRYKRRPDLLGQWSSSYQGIDEPAGEWVNETIEIKVHGSGLVLKNSDSSRGYDYTARANIFDRVHLHGTWTSIRQGANAHGAFLLTVAAQGNAMFGYWVGPDMAGSRRYGRWVLARDPSLIEATKNLLEQMRQPRPSSSPADLKYMPKHPSCPS